MKHIRIISGSFWKLYDLTPHLLFEGDIMFPNYRWGKIEAWVVSNLLKLTRLVHGRTRIWLQCIFYTEFPRWEHKLKTKPHKLKNLTTECANPKTLALGIVYYEILYILTFPYKSLWLHNKYFCWTRHCE